MIFSKAFWKGTGERAIKTFAQSLVAFVAADFASIVEVPWQDAAGVAGLAAMLSVFTSIGNADFTAGNGGVPVGTIVTPDYSDH